MEISHQNPDYQLFSFLFFFKSEALLMLDSHSLAVWPEGWGKVIVAPAVSGNFLQK